MEIYQKLLGVYKEIIFKEQRVRIFRFKEIDSTNKFLKEIKEKNDFDIAIAEVQTSGKGRRGNKWCSEKGGAYFSFLLKEDRNIAFEEYTKLPLVTGYSLMKTLEKIEPFLNFKFKWTNDIYENDKKISGILVEKIGDYFIIGIGINLNNEIKGEARNTAISIGKITLKEYNIEEIIIAAVENFKKDLAFYFNGNWEKMLDELNAKNYLYGKNIEISFENGNIEEGIALNIHKSGQLMVKTGDREKFFNIGEIHISKNN